MNIQNTTLPNLLREKLLSPLTRTGFPIILNDIDTVLFLAEGEMELFFIPKKHGMDMGRIHVCTLTPSLCRLAHEIPALDYQRFSYIAVPQPGAVYYELQGSELTDMASNNQEVNLFLTEQSLRFFSLLAEQEPPVAEQNGVWSPAELIKIITPNINQICSNLAQKNAARQQEQIQSVQINSEQALNKGFLNLIQLFSHKKEIPAEQSGDILWDACAMVFRLLGIKVTEQIEPSTNYSAERVEQICSILNIRKREISLESGWYKQSGMPFLAWKEEEQTPVAIYPDNEGEGLWHAYDPLNKSTALINEEVANSLSLKAIVFYTSFPEGKVTPGVLVRSVWDICKKDLKLLLVLLGGASLLGSMIPVFNGIIFSTVIPMSDYALLWQILILALSFALAQGIIDYLVSNLFLRIRSQAEWKLQSALWDRLLSMPVRFFRNYSVGDLAMRSQGIMQLSDIFSTATLKGILSAIIALPSLFIMFYFSVSMSFIMLSMIALFMMIFIIIAKLNLNLQKQIMTVSGELQGEVLQHLSGINKLRATGTENQAFNSWSIMFSKKKEIYKKAAHQSKYATLTGTLLPGLTILILMILVTANIMGEPDKVIKPADFIGFSSALALVSAGISGSVNSIISALSAIPIYQRMKPILEEECEVSSGKSMPGKITGSLSVNHVTFRYDPQQRPILDDLTLHIKSGEFVAIVGESGSGKSTLLRLLLGFELPQSGSITYDEMDLSKLDLKEFRKRIGVVLQNGKLLPDSIYRNIVAGNPNLTISDAWEAAKLAGCADDIAAMPMQMHTMLNTSSGGISGGQKQRILIARALVKKPALLFFDEATSALDNKTQHLVTESLKQMDITRIIIAHRLSTIQDADRILFMEKGHIVEEGNYKDLMALNGKFAAQAKRQLVNS